MMRAAGTDHVHSPQKNRRRKCRLICRQSERDSARTNATEHTSVTATAAPTPARKSLPHADKRDPPRDNATDDEEATARTRTGNLRFTKPLLCQLSYGGNSVNASRLASYIEDAFIGQRNSSAAPAAPRRVTPVFSPAIRLSLNTVGSALKHTAEVVRVKIGGGEIHSRDSSSEPGHPPARNDALPAADHSPRDPTKRAQVGPVFADAGDTVSESRLSRKQRISNRHEFLARVDVV